MWKRGLSVVPTQTQLSSREGGELCSTSPHSAVEGGCDGVRPCLAGGEMAWRTSSFIRGSWLNRPARFMIDKTYEAIKTTSGHYQAQ
jgi:hypothetical protein